jgi:hypothetical protein
LPYSFLKHPVGAGAITDRVCDWYSSTPST